MIAYIGSYTEQISPEIVGGGQGISAVVTSGDKWTLLEPIAQRNPSYLALSPCKGFLYATDEVSATKAPQTHSYRVNSDGSLSHLNQQPSRGSLACHLDIWNYHLLVSNYGSGSIEVFPIDETGSLSPMCQEVAHQGNGPNLARQESPHAHMIYPISDSLLYVADLGIDKCVAYTWQSRSLVPCPDQDLQLAAGEGARHLVKHSTEPWIYVMGELSGNISAFDISSGSPRLIDTQSVFADRNDSVPSGAALRISSDGQYLFASERSVNSVTAFQIHANGTLTRDSVKYLDSKTPREFNIAPDGSLWVAAQDSHEIDIFAFDSGDWTHQKKLEVRSPSCILFNH